MGLYFSGNGKGEENGAARFPPLLLKSEGNGVDFR